MARLVLELVPLWDWFYGSPKGTPLFWGGHALIFETHIVYGSVTDGKTPQLRNMTRQFPLLTRKLSHRIYFPPVSFWRGPYNVRAQQVRRWSRGFILHRCPLWGVSFFEGNPSFCCKGKPKRSTHRFEGPLKNAPNIHCEGVQHLHPPFGWFKDCLIQSQETQLPKADLLT